MSTSKHHSAGRRRARYADSARMRLLVPSIVLIWLVLAGRLVYLQGPGSDRLARQAQKQRVYTEIIPARPGNIYDRRGRLLATSVAASSLYVVPSRVEQPVEMADSLAGALGLDERNLLARLAKHRQSHFLWIKRRLSAEEAARIRALHLPERTWGFREEYLRQYPQGTLAAHVIGLRDIDGRGRGGVEEGFQSLLCGRDGRRIMLRDARGHLVHIDRDASEPQQHGRSLVLSLDTVIQLFAEEGLERVMQQWRPKSACICVMDPRTCEILAMASRPTFNPNHPAGVPDAAWKNTNIASVYEPGSTFKPFVVAEAIEQGLIQPEEIFHCEHGEYRMGRRILHDHHPYGRLNVVDILVKSSNIGMAKIGERLTNRGLYEATVAFGFGSRTGSGLPGELPGVVRPLEEWTSYSTGSVAMGQEISVTPLQMITAHAALANGGRLMTPRLVLSTGESFADISEYRPEPVALGQIISPVISPETADWLIREPLTQVVARGTGTNAKLQGYTVFGKTGTGQKIDPDTGRYSSRLHVSSFVCGAPAENPRALVLVMVDEPSVGTTHYGGTVSAPAAAAVLRKTLAHLQVPAEEAALRSAGR